MTQVTANTRNVFSTLFDPLVTDYPIAALQRVSLALSRSLWALKESVKLDDNELPRVLSLFALPVQKYRY